MNHIRLRERAVLKPHQLNNPNHENLIHDYLSRRFEGQISKYGYIFQDSLNILEIGPGRIIPTFFDGTVYYDVVFSCKVFNPPIGFVFKTKLSKTVAQGCSAYIVEDGITVMEIVIKKDRRSSTPSKNQFDIMVSSNEEVYVELTDKNITAPRSIMRGKGDIVDRPSVQKQLSENVSNEEESIISESYSTDSEEEEGEEPTPPPAAEKDGILDEEEGEEEEEEEEEDPALDLLDQPASDDDTDL